MHTNTEPLVVVACWALLAGIATPVVTRLGLHWAVGIVVVPAVILGLLYLLLLRNDRPPP